MSSIPISFEKYEGEIKEVKIGATKTEGGTRSYSVTVGGDKYLPLYSFEGINPNPPRIAYEVYCYHAPLPGSLFNFFGDLVDNPVEWSREAVNKFKAEMVNLRLTDAFSIRNETFKKEVSNVIEEVLQAVKVPLLITGVMDIIEMDDYRKNNEILTKSAEICEGEKCLIGPVYTDAFQEIGKACLEKKHPVLAKTNMDVNQALKLNTSLLNLGLTNKEIIMDVTTGALGYGIEYTFSTLERVKIRALRGDKILQSPSIIFSSESWLARELQEEDKLKTEKTGITFEVLTAITGIMAGANISSSLHPEAAKLINEFVNNFFNEPKQFITVEEWLKTR